MRGVHELPRLTVQEYAEPPRMETSARGVFANAGASGRCLPWLPELHGSWPITREPIHVQHRSLTTRIQTAVMRRLCPPGRTAALVAAIVAGLAACGNATTSPLRTVGQFALSVTPTGGTNYRAVVIFHGTRRAFVTCSVIGLDARGRRLWDRPWGLPLTQQEGMPFAPGAFMRPGERLSISYHLPGRPPTTGMPGRPPTTGVTKYVGTCRTWQQPPS
jgi:hypothetical protein